MGCNRGQGLAPSRRVPKLAAEPPVYAGCMEQAPGICAALPITAANWVPCMGSDTPRPGLRSLEGFGGWDGAHDQGYQPSGHGTAPVKLKRAAPLRAHGKRQSARKFEARPRHPPCFLGLVNRQQTRPPGVLPMGPLPMARPCPVSAGPPALPCFFFAGVIDTRASPANAALRACCLAPCIVRFSLAWPEQK